MSWTFDKLRDRRNQYDLELTKLRRKVAKSDDPGQRWELNKTIANLETERAKADDELQEAIDKLLD